MVGLCGEGLGWVSVQRANGGTEVRHVSVGGLSGDRRQLLFNGRRKGIDARSECRPEGWDCMW